MTKRCVLALALALASCNSAPARPDKEPRPRPPAPASASAAIAAPPSPSAAALTSAAPPRVEGDSLAGVWEGRFEAKKGSVSLPPKVKDKALAADEGKTAVGPGTLELFIGESGELRGTGRGALGACTLSGRAEEGMVRATINPDDPRAEGAMTGVLVGVRKGDVIRGEIHVAGPDATMVREATIELKKK